MTTPSYRYLISLPKANEWLRPQTHSCPSLRNPAASCADCDQAAENDDFIHEINRLDTVIHIIKVDGTVVSLPAVTGLEVAVEMANLMDLYMDFKDIEIEGLGKAVK